jgi:hypothetical protein
MSTAPTAENHACSACGMSVEPHAYHPYAACLMFRACHDGNVVDANLKAVVEYGRLKERVAMGKVKKAS